MVFLKGLFTSKRRLLLLTITVVSALAIAGVIAGLVVGLRKQNLGSQTRKFSTRNGYDLNEARDLCFAINRYDKLRLVALINNETIIALFEFSLSIVENEYKRFSEKYGIILNEVTDMRFGPCISDQYQNRHFGCWLFEKVKPMGKLMGKERLILWVVFLLIINVL
ncbi:unnamed protein product [Rotaria socialis]